MSRLSFRRGLPSTAGVPAAADKRFRRPDVRPGRRRRVVHLIRRSVGVVVAFVLVAGGAFSGMRAVLGAERLRVSRLTIRGNTRLSNGEVEALLDGVRSQNILLVDLEQYRQRLMGSPWVAGAVFHRVLPATLDVVVVERVPMAVARLDQQLYLVDSRGVVIDEYGPQYREFDLPLVDGLVTRPTHGTPVADPVRAQLVERVVEELRVRPDLRQRVSQIDVSNPRDVVVLLDTDAVLVHLGEGRFVERLKTYVELGPTLQERLHDIDYVDMRYDERVYVRSAKNAAPGARGRGRK